MRRLATSREVSEFRPIRGQEIISDRQTHTHRESTYWKALLYEQRLQKHDSAGTGDNDDDEESESPYEWMNFKDLPGKYEWHDKEGIRPNIPQYS